MKPGHYGWEAEVRRWMGFLLQDRGSRLSVSGLWFQIGGPAVHFGIGGAYLEQALFFVIAPAPAGGRRKCVGGWGSFYKTTEADRLLEVTGCRYGPQRSGAPSPARSADHPPASASVARTSTRQCSSSLFRPLRAGSGCASVAGFLLQDH